MHARDMMLQMSASLRNVRHGHDHTTEFIFVLGIYLLLAMGGQVLMMIGAVISAVWLFAHIWQDHRFSFKPWLLFGMFTILVFLLVLGLAYFGVWFALGSYAEKSVHVEAARHTVAAVIAIFPALIAYVLVRRTRRASLEAGWQAWTDEEDEIIAALPKQRAVWRHRLDLVLIAIGASVIVVIIVRGGVQHLFWAIKDIGETALPLVLFGLFAFGPILLGLVFGYAVHSVMERRR